MKPDALVAGAVFLVLSFVLSGFSWRSPELRLTVRRQFDGWHDLLELFRSTKDVQAMGGASVFKDRALQFAWCNFTLPFETVRAPFCRCVDRAASSFANASSTAEESVMNIVSCIHARPVWRVEDFWGVSYTTPAVYVLFIATCFLLVGSDVRSNYLNVLIWSATAAFFIVLVVADYVHNTFWALTFVIVSALISLILLPGMTSSNEGEAAGSIQRTPSCFWWAEYLSAPVFALYVPLMHCGRDFAFAGVFTMVGTAIGGLGLRSFWCAEVYKDGPKKQFQSLMQRIVWLGILASCVSLLMFTAIYYEDDRPLMMGRLSVALLVLTMLVSLLQWPGNQDWKYLLETQMGLAGVRNILLFIVVAYDAWS